MKKLVIFVLLVISQQIIFANNHFDCTDYSQEGAKVIFELSDYKFKTRSDFTAVILQNCNNFTVEPGKPRLPIISGTIAIPNRGKISASIKIIDSKIKENLRIIPSKKQENPDENIFMSKEIYNENTEYPQQIFNLHEPKIMRDYRIVSFDLKPFIYNDKKREIRIIKSAEIQIEFNLNKPGINEKNSRNSTLVSPAFSNIYQKTFINYDFLANRDTNSNEHILYILPDDNNVMTIIQTLLDWKHRSGYIVSTATTAETGTNASSIKSYILNAYNNWEDPPAYVVLVGDAGGSYEIPTWFESSSYSGEGDHPYARLEGDDEAEDVFIGRLSFSNTTELATIVNKNINFEKDPYLTETDWYEDILLVGDTNPSGISTISTNKYIKEIALDFNPNYEFTELYSSEPSANSMNTAIDDGILFFNYNERMG